MRIAVTGAGGFVGSHVCRALRADAHEVLPFGRRPATALGAPIAGYRQWDVSQRTDNLDGVDAVVHCAAAVGQWGSFDDYHAVNVRGTEHVVASLPRGARLVHISTASVYAKGGAVALREDQPLVERGLSAYAATKASADRYLLSLDRSIVLLRPHIVYGPGDTTLWPRVLAAVRGRSLSIPGDGRARVSTTHIDHLVQAVGLALRPNAPRGAFNVADVEPTTVSSLLETMFRRHGLDIRLRYVPRPLAWGAALACEAVWSALRRATEPPITRYMVASLADHCVLDISRARERLGFTPQWSIADAPL